MVYGFSLIWFYELFLSNWWELKRSELFFFFFRFTNRWIENVYWIIGRLEFSDLIQFTVLFVVQIWGLIYMFKRRSCFWSGLGIFESGEVFEVMCVTCWVWITIWFLNWIWEELSRRLWWTQKGNLGWDFILMCINHLVSVE